MYHLVFDLKNQNKYLLKENNFPFGEVGASKSFELNPFVRGQHSLQLLFAKDSIRSGWRKKEEQFVLSGKYKVKVFKNEELIYEDHISKAVRYTYQKDNMDYYSSATLLYFNLPITGFNLVKLKLTIEVEIGDKLLAAESSKIELAFKVSLDH